MSVQGPIVVSDDSGCLDLVAKLPPQDWGRADKLTQITRRALKAWLNEDRKERGLDYTANVSVLSLEFRIRIRA